MLASAQPRNHWTPNVAFTGMALYPIRVTGVEASSQGALFHEGGKIAKRCKATPLKDST